MRSTATLFMCVEPDSAQKFLRQLRARQRNQILFIILGVLLIIGIAPTRYGDFSFDIAKLVLVPVGFLAILVRLLVPGSRRLGTHTFRNDSAKIYAGGAWYVFQEVDVKKIQKMVLRHASFAGGQFSLVLLVFKHRSGGRAGGVFPLYFCLQNSDLDHVRNWCRGHNIHVREETHVTSPHELPLFIR